MNILYKDLKKSKNQQSELVIIYIYYLSNYHFNEFA